MCGIAGILGLEGLSDVSKKAELLINGLSHRGPDAFGHFKDEEVLLVQTRLSIIDLDTRSHQPFYDPEGRYVLVFNGELYNYREVKQKLPDYRFVTESDTEVLMAAWKQWGLECVHQFNGMFAIAMWDRQTQTLFLVRDRLGIKPIYFYRGDQHYLFSSEIRAMLDTGLVPRKLASEYLSEYLRYQTVHAPRTLIQDVLLIPPGQYLQIQGENISEGKYWDLAENTQQFSGNEQDAKNNISRLLTEAVERRLVSDVPLGAFLSGGIDSSLLVGIASERLDKKLDTFSITFEENEFSEAPYSRLIAKKFSAQHHELELSAAGFLKDIPKALSAMDHPSGDGPNSYMVSQAVKKAGITVALSGLGGDELFAGYPFFTRYHSLQSKRFLLSYPKYIRQLIAKPIEWLKSYVSGQKMAETLLLPYFTIPHVYPINRRVLSEKWVKQLLSHPSDLDLMKQGLMNLFEFGNPAASLPLLSQVSVAEISTYMQHVLLRDTDQMSMAHALEVRVPFLDYKLVEYVMGIPDALKYPKFAKSLLVESFDGLLPDEIVHRPKMGFVLPWDQWMREELKPLCEEGLEYLSQSEYFSAKGVTSLYAHFLKGDKTISWSRVWPLVALGTWMKNNRIE